MMNRMNTNSPLYGIRQPLTLLRWTLGFPLQTEDPTFSQFHFVSHTECLRFAVFISIMLFEYVFMSMTFLINEGDLDKFHEFYASNFNQMSESKIDKLLPAIFRLSSIVFSLIYLLVFKYNANAISNLSQDVNKQRTHLLAMLIIQKVERKRFYCRYELEYATKTILYGQFLNILASIIWGLWLHYFLIYHDEQPSFADYKYTIQIVYPIIIIIEMLLIGFGPMACSAEIVIGQIVDSITDLYCQWELAFECSGTKDTKNSSDCEEENDCHGNRIKFENRKT